MTEEGMEGKLNKKGKSHPAKARQDNLENDDRYDDAAKQRKKRKANRRGATEANLTVKNEQTLGMPNDLNNSWDSN